MVKNSYIILISALAFFIPVWPNILPVLIILIVLNSFFIPFRSLSRNEGMMLISLTGIYLLYILGLTYSENQGKAMFSLEVKLSFLIFPLVFFFHPPFSKEERDKILKWFYFGSAFSVVMCLLYATYNFISTKYLIAQGDKELWDFGMNFYFKERLSPFLHPSYLSMYYVFAMIVGYAMKDDLPERPGIIFNSVLFPLAIVLLVSKSGVFTLLIWLLYLFRRKIKMGFSVRKLLFILMAGMGVIALFVVSVPEFRGRFTEMTHAFSSAKQIGEKSSSTRVRQNVWKVGMEIMRDHPLLGVGPGDAREELLIRYEEQGLNDELEHEYNCHNQYLETGIATGLTGVVLLLLALLVPLWGSIRRNYFLLTAFLLLIIVNILVESMFETQAGVIFYAFMNSLLICTSLDTEKHVAIFPPKN